ncbi:hypothetical protein [Pseudomonas granadensis]|uniref:hypothetical protein n=1 Tax=Pseudomonas granadensis TaxID=1421430 RepID=UPI0012FE5543|nr:hypothetical protein [Pseudomonas granadensis]
MPKRFQPCPDHQFRSAKTQAPRAHANTQNASENPGNGGGLDGLGGGRLPGPGRAGNQLPSPSIVDLLVMPQATEIEFKPARVVINYRCIER